MKKDKKRIRWLELFNFINIVFFVALLIAGCLFAMTVAQVTTLKGIEGADKTAQTIIDQATKPALDKAIKWRENFFCMAAGVGALLVISTLSSGISVFAIKWQAEWTRKHKGGYGLLIVLFSLILLGIVAIMLFTTKAKFDLKYRPNQPIVVPASKKGKKGQPQQPAANPYLANQYAQQQNANQYMANQYPQQQVQQPKQPQQFPQNQYGQFNQNGYGMMPNQNQFYNQQYQYPQNNNHSQNFQYSQNNMQSSQQWNYDSKMFENGNKK